MKRYWVYILAGTSKTVYTGVANDCVRRVLEHRSGIGSDFTSKFRIHRPVHGEETADGRQAIAREKQIKGWSRQKRLTGSKFRIPVGRTLPPIGQKHRIPRIGARNDGLA